LKFVSPLTGGTEPKGTKETRNRFASELEETEEAEATPYSPSLAERGWRTVVEPLICADGTLIRRGNEMSEDQRRLAVKLGKPGVSDNQQSDLRETQMSDVAM
jgi:hypothetical protein